ncbi:MAG: T9SS type A sorting domain-containing protein [Bacteroidetes bacterium]|nr:T9SS type A sorting domain-containing protein [Bacteroidota bacterium]MBP7398862.1 T9SS type A sorting domain-containing protein [Chitinophagales bacterium]MBP8753445.1 T9SS type A sorting domain-containing protein [Chitinophagales bacterium]MBP9188482.1 T9SS type A sorting domain-containing protein [Chitinophagales bacterium]MBP9548863.1 T9SS type A sorting domain-containing protein [Chitinophagales bacterium]
MKSIYTTLFFLAITFSENQVFAQLIDPPCEIPGATLCDNIDAYVSGEAIGPQATWWSTWSGSEGGGEDGLVTSDYAYSGSNSMQISEGGSNDVILKLGDMSEGFFRLEWMMYVPDGKTGYYNIQETEVPGVAWNLELLFGLSAVGVPSSSGEGTISIPFGSGDFTYPVDAWFKVEQLIDLDANTIDVIVDGVDVASFAYAGNIGGIDFYSIDANCRYYIDDVLFTDVVTEVVNVTYQVDVTNYLAEGGVIGAGGMRVGGNFADLGSALPNWTPSDPACAMTDIGDNIWEITVEYPLGSAGLTQEYKYVNTDWFPTGENEYDDGATSLFGDLGCGGDNREVTVPSSDATYLYCWEECSACEDVSICDPVPPTDLYVDEINAFGGMIHWTIAPGTPVTKGTIWELSTGDFRKFTLYDANSYHTPGELLPSTTYGVRVKSGCLEGEVWTPSEFTDWYYFTTDPLRVGQFAQQIMLYPNPNNGNFRLQLNGSANFETSVEVFNMAGQLMSSQLIHSDDAVITLDIQMGNPAPGSYIVKVVSGENITMLPVIIE